MVLHLHDAALSCHRSIMITASDTDVLVIILSNFHRIPDSEIWMLFGVGKHQRYIAVHEIANSLGPMKCRSMSIFHALTGCDVTSFFCGRGKKSAWDTWDVYPDITNMFLELSDAPIELTGNNLNLCERFVILMYDRTSDLMAVNDARRHLFSRRSKALESIPPTQSALTQHLLRAVYQGGHVWGKALQANQTLPSPSLWGWEKPGTGTWKPRWTTLGQAQDMCYELIHCGCKKACRGLCKCSKASLKCTALCFCEGRCFPE
jgi:hypothetical protein